MFRDWMNVSHLKLSSNQEKKLAKLINGEAHLWDFTPGFQWSDELKKEVLEYEEAVKHNPWNVNPGMDFIPVIDLQTWPSWFLDSTHCIPAWTPLYAAYWNFGCPYGQKVIAEKLNFPFYRGVENRYFLGEAYAACFSLWEEEKIKEKEAKFIQSIKPWLENFDSNWEGQKQELLKIYHKLTEFDFDNATNMDLMHHHWDLEAMYRRMWEIHFLGMQSSYGAWLLFETLARQQFNITDESDEFQKMMRGFDSKVYQTDKEMWQLGQFAYKLGLADIFSKYSGKELLSQLQKDERAKEWMSKFKEFLNREGWRMVRMNDLVEPYWLEDPSIPLDIIKGFVREEAEFTLDVIRKKLANEREEEIRKFLENVPKDERGWFEMLIRAAGKASAYSEEHDIYCELYSQAIMRRSYLKIGDRLVEAGTIKRNDDIFFLNPDEIERVLMMPEVHDMTWLTEKRRANWEKYRARITPPVITLRDSIEEALEKDLLPNKDPIMIKCSIGRAPIVIKDLKADLFGTPGSPGLAEGTARVIIYYSELSKVQDGDILVCPGTNPAWTPVFARIKGLVSDRGGVLSHAAIVAREFGIPAVVNCFVGTQKIKDGQKIRIDGSKGAIYLLTE